MYVNAVDVEVARLRLLWAMLDVRLSSPNVLLTATALR